MLLTTNGNFTPTNAAHANLMGRDNSPFLTPTSMAELTDSIGADGVEILPIRSPLWARLQTPGTIPHAHLYGAWHESFLGLGQEQPAPEAGITTADIASNSHDSGGLMRFAAPVLMPKGEASVRSMSRAAKRLGNNALATCVLFLDPAGNPDKDREHAALFPGGANVQYTPDVLAFLGINPVDPEAGRKLVIALADRNVGAVVPSFHGGRLGKIVRKRLDEDAIRQELLQQGMVGEVHVELARIDFMSTDPERVETSIKETVALMQDKSLESLPLGRTLADLQSVNWQGNTLVELPLGGVAAALQAQGLRATKQTILQAYADVNGHLRQQLPRGAVSPQ